MKIIAAIALFCGLCLRSAAEDSAPYQWKNVVIGGGGFVTGLIAHPRAKNLLYARTDVGGAYRWDEASRRWIPITDSFGEEDFTGIESIALDPNDTNRVYLAAGIYEFSRAAIFRSDDQGRTWQKTDVPFKMGGNETGRFNGERLAVSPIDGKELFFGTRRDGLWKSIDRGVTWNQVKNFPEIAGENPAPNDSRPFFHKRSVGIICVLINHRTIYAAASTAGTNLFSSVDDGDHWKAIPGQPIGLRPNHVVLAADGILYLSYGREPGPNEMTGGAVWKFDPAKNLWSDITPLESPDAGQPFGYGSVAVDPEAPRTILTSTFCRWHPHDEMFRSTNSGATWSPMFANAAWDSRRAPYAATMKPHWIGSIVISPFDSSKIWFTTGYGVWGCTNLVAADSGGKTRWNFCDDGLEETVPLALASPPIGAHLLSGVGDIDGFVHDDLDMSPAHGSFAGPHFINTQEIAFAARNAQFVVRTGTTRVSGSHVALSADGGKTWRFLDREPSPGEGGGLVAISSDGKTIVLTKYGLAPEWTVDQGNTWKDCAGLPPEIRVVADTVNPSRFYAFNSYTGQMYASTNGAASFTPAQFRFPFAIPPGEFGPPRAANLTAVLNCEGDLWLAFGPHGLWHSSDGGNHFIKIANVAAAFAFGCGKSAAPDGPPTLFLFGTVESLDGIFRSDDNGRSWVCIDNSRHPFGGITRLTGDPRIYGRVYLATVGRGIIYGDKVWSSDGQISTRE